MDLRKLLEVMEIFSIFIVETVLEYMYMSIFIKLYTSNICKYTSITSIKLETISIIIPLKKKKNRDLVLNQIRNRHSSNAHRSSVCIIDWQEEGDSLNLFILISKAFKI